jgi:capsid protein
MFDRVRSSLAKFIAPPRARAFDATKMGRLYSDWIASATSSDAEIRNSFRRLLDRSRDLERNNDYQRG